MASLMVMALMKCLLYSVSYRNQQPFNMMLSPETLVTLDEDKLHPGQDQHHCGYTKSLAFMNHSDLFY